MLHEFKFYGTRLANLKSIIGRMIRHKLELRRVT